MASATVKEFSYAWWAEVYNRIIGAAVFIDEGAAECLHWEGGLFNLIFSGAKCVKLLSPFELCPKQFKKAVFITQADQVHLDSIRTLIQNAEFTHCILISSMSMELLYSELVKMEDRCNFAASGQAPDKAAKLLTDLLQEWMGLGDEGVVEAIHIPVFNISLTDVIFTLPPFKNHFSTNNGQLLKEPMADLQSLHVDERRRVRRLACALNSMLDSMNLKDDVYYMGNYSALVAGVLENSPVYVNRRKNSLHPTSLIIVDRTLDLCSVTSHSSESVFDKMRLVLPAFPGHAHEVAVDMSPLCQAKSVNHPHDVHMSPGCVWHSNEEHCAHTFDHMINKTQKEVMLDVYNKLSSLDVNKSPSSKNLLKVTPQALEKMIYAYKGDYNIINKHPGLLQLGLALVQMLKSPKRSTMDLLMNIEKQVLQSLATSRESTSVLTQIAHLIKTRKQRGLPLEDLIGLLIHVYSLTGTEFPLSKPHQLEILDALTTAIMEEWKTLLTTPPEEMTLEIARNIAEGVMVKLNEIKFMRKSMTKYNSLLKPCEVGGGYEYKGILQQLVDDLVSSSRPEIPDLLHRSDGLRDLLRTRFTMFSGNTRRPNHPLDNETVIIFIIGGTTSEECKRLHRSVITSGVDNTVLFGSTRLLTPQETATQLIGL